MGKGSLIVVFSAVLAGSAVLFNVQVTGQRAEAQQARFREDVIARTNAESARQRVASEVMTSGGVKETVSLPSNGGWMQVKDMKAAQPGSPGWFVVEGRSAGHSAKGMDPGAAVHRIRTEYRALASIDWPTTLGANGFPTYLKNKSNDPDSSGQIIMGANQKTYVDMQGFWELVNKPGVGLTQDDYQARRASILSALQAAGVAAGQVVFTGEGEQALYDAAAEADIDATLRNTFVENNPGIANEDAQDHFGLDWFYQQVKYGDVMQSDRDLYIAPSESDAPYAWTAADGDLGNEARIVYVERDAVIKKGASLKGEGLLLVDGDFVVEKGATFDWKGLVMVRGEEAQYRKMDLGGNVTINGAVFGMQDAHDPGGHMDVTVWGDPSGDWTHPYGDMETVGSKQLGCGTMPGCQPSRTRNDGHRPWWQHTHKYDLSISGAAGYKIPFIRNKSAPSSPYRGKLRMKDLLDRLPGSEEYYLQFGDGAEVRNAGYAHFSVDLRGANEWSAADRSVQDGFEGGAATYQSPLFKPSDLYQFELEVGSLQGLAKLWNEAAQDCYWGANYRKCPELSPDYEEGQVTDYPVWVGNDKEHRQGAFTVKLRRAADDAVVYEAAAYWHKKPSEKEKEEKESEELGDEIMAGGTQGLDVYLGPNAVVNSSNPSAMLDLGGLFNITNQTNVQPLRVSAQHFSVGEPGHVYGDDPYAKPFDEEDAGDNDDNTLVIVCHRGKTNTFTMKKYRDHSDHTKMGACSADDDDEEDD